MTEPKNNRDDSHIAAGSNKLKSVSPILTVDLVVVTELEEVEMTLGGEKE